MQTKSYLRAQSRGNSGFARVLTMLVLLAAVVTGAVAQTTYKVSVKKGAKDASNWTITPTAATTTGVAKGQTVTLKYNGRLKVKGVKALTDVKPAATVKSITIAADFHTTGSVATAPEMTIEYTEGEKWSDVAARYDWLNTYETYTVYYSADKKSGDLHTANGGVKPSDLVDPNKSYYWGYE